MIIHDIDRAIAFDFDHTVKMNFLVLYRPITGTVWIMSELYSN